MKTEAELNAEYSKRFEQLAPEQKAMFNDYLIQQLAAAESGEICVSRIPAIMIIPAE